MTAVSLVLLLCAASAAAQPAGLTPDQLLDRGKASLRSGDTAAAIDDLREAAAQYLGPEQKRQYIDTGHLETLPQLETSLVYLALAYNKAGQENDARDTVMRLLSAERMGATYATLVLGEDATEFKALAARLVPSIALPANGGSVFTDTPQTQASAPTPAAPTADQQVAAANEQIQKEAAEKIAAAKRDADARVAAEIAAIDKAADDAIAAARQAADERVALARTAIEKAADERIAAARKAAAPKHAPKIEKDETVRAPIPSLRQADALATAGDVDGASSIYARIATTPDVPREVLAGAATGLYRTGDYRDAVNAFRRLAPFARGEEDLRYYNAVSLYEVGDFEQAKKELACALPYIEITDDVSRYRLKIEQ